jgi:hypothetical protein
MDQLEVSLSIYWSQGTSERSESTDVPVELQGRLDPRCSGQEQSGYDYSGKKGMTVTSVLSRRIFCLFI